MADTLDGRFETMALHGALALIRLRAEPALGPLAQAFTDDFFRLLDSGLREEGVGDTSVPKRMHRLASAFYGRLDAYGAAIGARNSEALVAALGRNVMKDEASAFAPALAEYALRVAAHQGERPASAMFTAEGWPALQA
ncbi:MAG: ubiquinol-cytochrome C chaperone family protein [Hyphomonadaceae bacterium]